MPTAAYLLLPWFATNGGACDVGQGDSVHLVKVFLPGSITVTEIAAMASASVTGEHWGFGLYDLDGNLVLDSGPIVMATTGSDELLNATIAPVEIAKGVYWLACTTDSLTSTIVGAQISAVAITAILGGTSLLGLAANSSSGGQLPATTGVISTPAEPTVADQVCPFVKLQA